MVRQRYYGWPDYFNNSEPVNNNSKFLSASSPNNQLPQIFDKKSSSSGKTLITFR